MMSVSVAPVPKELRPQARTCSEAIHGVFTHVGGGKCFGLRDRLDIARANQKPLFT